MPPQRLLAQAVNEADRPAPLASYLVLALLAVVAAAGIGVSVWMHRNFHSWVLARMAHRPAADDRRSGPDPDRDPTPD